MTTEKISLDTLMPGEGGQILSIEPISTRIRQRLLEMGLTKGTPVELVRRAPLGDPIEISVRGYRLSLRREEAESVIIQRTSSPA